MDATLWDKVHGATTHFPIALVLCSGVLDALGFCLSGRPSVRSLHAGGYWTILLGAGGTIPTVASGLLLTRGRMLGHDALRMHHLFVWPAFTLIVGLAVWRWMVGRRPTRAAFALYLLGVGAAAALTLAAGYWGGELLLST